jgi:hypothetical protein
MSENIPNHRDLFKAQALSNPAKLLRAYMAATGITDAKQIAAELDIPIRTIQRLKLEVACAMGGVASATAKCANDAMDGASSDIGVAPNAPPVASRARVEDKLTSLQVVDRPESEVQCSEVLLCSSAKPKREAHGSRLDREWKLPDDWRQWARASFPQSTAESIQLQADTFRDYWVAAAGQRGRKVDWEATWRNWCRKAFATGPLRPHAQPMPDWKEAKRQKDREFFQSVGLVQ